MDAILVYWLLEELDAESRYQFELSLPAQMCRHSKSWIHSWIDEAVHAIQWITSLKLPFPRQLLKRCMKKPTLQLLGTPQVGRWKNAMGSIPSSSVIAASSWAPVRQRQWWGSSNFARTVRGANSWLTFYRSWVAALATRGIINHCTLIVQSSSKLVWRVEQNSVVSHFYCQQQ